MVTGVHLMKEQGPLILKQIAAMCGVLYTEAIGCVLWPVMIMHLDCAFTVGILSQFIQNPRAVHWEALKHLMIYLGSTKKL